MLSNNQKSNKKPYHSPQLFSYGDIRELTQGTTGNSGNDNPKFGLSKTQ
ncbi:lasso RiPP family leader peptide-containing protein [Phormidium sp. LEGE 05292]|nr:lasso RiPP family leader peptide-containing protein [Phormidium sp. LEGE 05292]